MNYIKCFCWRSSTSWSFGCHCGRCTWLLPAALALTGCFGGRWAYRRSAGNLVSFFFNSVSCSEGEGWTNGCPMSSGSGHAPDHLGEGEGCRGCVCVCVFDSHQGCQSHPCTPDWCGLYPWTCWRTGTCRPASPARPPSGSGSQPSPPLFMTTGQLFINIIQTDDRFDRLFG